MGTFFNYEKLKKGLTGAVTVAAGAVSQGLEVAKNLAEDLTSFKALKDYKLAGTSGPLQPGTGACQGQARTCRD
jgi:hypothetical protein